MGSCYSSVVGERSNTVEILTGDAGAAPAAAIAKDSSSPEVEATSASTTVTTLKSTCSSSSSKVKRRKRWKKNSTTGNGVGGGVDEVHEIEVPGKLCMNGATKAACLYTQQGKKGINQDAMLVLENFSSRSDTIFCGIFDGHGPFGHMVAKTVRDDLPRFVCSQWKAISSTELSNLCKIGDDDQSMNSDETTVSKTDMEWGELLDLKENGELPEMYIQLKLSMLKAFKLMDKELKLHKSIDCFCSGSTAVTLVKQGEHLVIGNVGDSRAVLAMRDKDNTLVAVQLTVDLKPDLPGEAARIMQCKGRVFALQDEPEVARVWLPNNDSPGLAMARAFGDFCLKDFGLISVPVVYYRHLTDRDEFIILATDGVWDVLSNKEAVDVVASAPTRTTAARALVDCATRAWRLKYPTSKNDDCAVVCLFLDDDGDEVLEVVSKSRLERSSSKQGSDEIVPVPVPVPVSEIELVEEKISGKSPSQSKRSLAEYILTPEEDEEWSALEGITKVNSLLSVPRFLFGDKRSVSWKKWR